MDGRGRTRLIRNRCRRTFAKSLAEGERLKTNLL
jgi:hypothetical protein